LLLSLRQPYGAGAQQAQPTGSAGYSAKERRCQRKRQQLLAPIAALPGLPGSADSELRPSQNQIAAAAAGCNRTGLSKGDSMQSRCKQPWDPSVKALTQFSLRARQSGEEPQLDVQRWRGVSHASADVMSAMQVLRTKAKAAGNLKSRLTDLRVQSRRSHRDQLRTKWYTPVQPHGGLRLSLCDPHTFAPPVAATA